MSLRPSVAATTGVAMPEVCADLGALERLGIGSGSLVTDSRAIKGGETFLAYAGEKSDGRRFIQEAIVAGARAVLWERQGFAWDPVWNVPNLSISGLRSKAGLIADHLYGHPSRNLWVIGITGTNGKTSCSQWIAQAMVALGRKTAIIGTLGVGFPEELESTINTTPDAVVLQAEMADFLRRGACSVVMEVSSHGIMQERINGTTFAVAMLTNLSRDHLDYHASMKNYAEAKARLFRWPGLRYAVLNLDDEFGLDLYRELQGTDKKIIGYGFTEPSLPEGDPKKFRMLRGRDLKVSSHGLKFGIEFETGHVQFETGLMGRFNASNLLGVLAVLLASGIDLGDAADALRRVRPIEGRMQKMGGGDAPLVIVDYAHTPDAMEKVLTTVREMLDVGRGEHSPQGRRLICVFGCGGERDRGKRPMLGEVATRLADDVIITSDNPRREDPAAIIDEIAAGAAANHRIEIDRARAIDWAIGNAQKGDVVLIAGKGHEASQEMGGAKLPFSDVEVARQALEKARISA